jgi:glyoxylase-like metal-dependent hydrolase (beta-lactamase superfamily II)
MTDASHFSEKQIPIWAGQQDALFFQHPEIMTASGLDDKILPCSVEHYAEDGKFYEIFPKFFLKTLHVPGHSPGSIAYFFPLCSIAFVGDTLFANGIGRTDFPGGSRTLLIKSIRDKLYTLPDETIIVPGHGSTTSIAQEKQTNPYVTY